MSRAVTVGMTSLTYRSMVLDGSQTSNHGLTRLSQLRVWRSCAMNVSTRSLKVRNGRSTICTAPGGIDERGEGRAFEEPLAPHMGCLVAPAQKRSQVCEERPEVRVLDCVP